MTPLRWLAACGTAAVVTGSAIPAGAQAPEPQTVVFVARDGVQVTGSLFLPDRRPAPGVVLLPMAGRSRHDWDHAGEVFARAGVVALAIDFRPAFSAATADAGSLQTLTRDAEAARAYLAARPEVAYDRIGLAGASLGANIAALVAASDPVVRALILLSPSLDYRGVRIEQAMTKYVGRPALIVASAEDPYALRSARALVTAGDGQRELRVLSEAGHGTIMLARQPELAESLVDWLLRALL